MIRYEPIKKTMKDKGISTYTLIKTHNISASTINRIRKNLPLTTTTLNDLCQILDCQVNEIMEYIPDKNDDKKAKNEDIE